MTETIYTYSQSADFPGGLAPGQLHTEIENNVTITTVLNRVDTDGDQVDIVFADALSAPELTELETVVIPNHVPDPLSFIVNTEGYLNLTSTLADGSAININATDAVGGIQINANNQVNIDAGAASNFTTSNGDLTLESAGIVHVEADGGIRIGMQNDAQAILIGNSTSVRPITIGNQTGATSVNVETGSGGLNVDCLGAFSLDANATSSNISLATTGNDQDLTISLTGANDSSIIIDSAGTGSDAIKLRTDGSMDLDATGSFNLATGANVGGAITLDASFNNGGVNISSGSMGIAINSGTGLLGIGHWSAGSIQIGTVASAVPITIGNITSTTGVTVNSGTGGINIGGNSSPGEIHIGNTAVAKSMFIGNNTAGSRVFYRHGSGGLYQNQPAPTALADSNNAISVGALITGILVGTPTADRTQTLPDADTIVSTISGIQVDDSFDFHLINNSVTDDAEWVVTAGTGGSIEGNPNVSPRENVINSYKNSGSSWFRLRMTNVTASSEAYTVYRLS